MVYRLGVVVGILGALFAACIAAFGVALLVGAIGNEPAVGWIFLIGSAPVYGAGRIGRYVLSGY